MLNSSRLSVTMPLKQGSSFYPLAIVTDLCSVRNFWSAKACGYIYVCLGVCLHIHKCSRAARVALQMNLHLAE